MSATRPSGKSIFQGEPLFQPHSMVTPNQYLRPTASRSAPPTAVRGGSAQIFSWRCAQLSVSQVACGMAAVRQDLQAQPASNSRPPGSNRPAQRHRSHTAESAGAPHQMRSSDGCCEQNEYPFPAHRDRSPHNRPRAQAVHPDIWSSPTSVQVRDCRKKNAGKRVAALRRKINGCCMPGSGKRVHWESLVQPIPTCGSHNSRVDFGPANALYQFADYGIPGMDKADNVISRPGSAAPTKNGTRRLEVTGTSQCAAQKNSAP